MNQVSDTSVIRITQYEALQSEIAIAQQEAAKAVFQYRDPKGNKAARSHVHALRLLKGKVETARKEAKSYALEYGRRVDGLAKELTAQVEALIEPHAIELQQIEDEEKNRVAAHRAVIDRLIAARTDPIADSAEAAQRGKDAAAVDIAGLQEFVAEAEREQAATVEHLRNEWKRLKKQEDDAAELERLRQEQIKREQEERERRIAEEAAAKAKAEAEAKAQREAQERAEAEAKREAQRIAAEQAAAEREAQAKAAAEAAERRAAELEARAKADEERRQREAKEATDSAAKEAAEREARKEAAIAAIESAIADMTPRQIAEAIVAGDVPHVQYF